MIQSKSEGDRSVDPLGTPYLTDSISGEHDIKTNCCRLEKYDINQLLAKP